MNVQFVVFGTKLQVEPSRKKNTTFVQINICQYVCYELVNIRGASLSSSQGGPKTALNMDNLES